MLTVVAALIKSEDKLLVCQRRRNDSFPLMWEFPGGKAQPGESLPVALERELEEELGVKSRVGPEVYRTRHQYVELREPIELVFFTAELESLDVLNLNFEQIAWREPATLPALNFLPADRELIEKLSTGKLRLP
jgi:8-oxo-dGTP diphosphatase